jgi:tRNA A37 threonylcarbamoyladenosine dehydratase
MDPYEARFGGVARLFGAAGLERLRQAHVCVVGVGGVGSWAVEALARSGLGRLTLVDFDEVCISNTNRQLHALAGDFGSPKVEVLARRVRAINPDCGVQPLTVFFTPATATQVLEPQFSFVVDAIDQTDNKCLLIARCRERGLPIVTTGGAGGRRDPTQVRVADLAFTTHDGLLDQVRSRLRKEFGFPRGKQPFGVDCVFSAEPQVYPAQDGGVCARRSEASRLRIDCETGFGTATFVTGTFGFAAAAVVVRKLAVSGRSFEERG